MGHYINPPDKTKEQFLEEHAKSVALPIVNAYEYNADHHPTLVPICLIDNGHFTAAGVLMDATERRAFIEDGTGRPRKWYMCPIDVLDKRAGLGEKYPEWLRSSLRKKE